MEANHNIEDQKWVLLAKSLYDQEPSLQGEGNGLPADEWPADSKEKEEALLISKKVDLYFQLQNYTVDQAWNKVLGQIQPAAQSSSSKVRRLIAHPLLRIAAVLMIAALLSVASYEMVYHWGGSTQLVELAAASQQVKTITLPDGTLVSINSNTRLEYPKRFGKNTREVTIEGEAFFEVSPNKDKPFIIHAGDAQIKVLGTSFNVSAYPNEKLMEVIVKTGKVQVLNTVTADNQLNELILNPGEKGTMVYLSNALLKTTNENPNFIAWKTHVLIFRATSLGEVISNLEKVYKVEILLEDPALSDLLLTAHFNDNSLDFILKVIETTFQMETLQVNGQYLLKTKS